MLKWQCMVFIILSFANVSLGIGGAATCPGDDYYAKEANERYMRLIHEINPSAYAKLKECEAKLKCACIKKEEDKSYVDEGSEKTLGQPILILEPWILEQKEDPGVRDYFGSILRQYLDSFPEAATANQAAGKASYKAQAKQLRQKIKNIIKEIAPTLFDAIMKRDPEFKHHINTTDIASTLSVLPSKTDGLPVIFSIPSIQYFPANELRFGIAHELAHYIMGHPAELYKITNLSKKDNDLLNNAKQRILENEADRIAILDFGINVDDAIAFAKELLSAAKEDELKHPERKTLLSSHPLWTARIKNLEALRREVAMQKTRQEAPKPIDWEGLAQRYLGVYLRGSKF